MLQDEESKGDLYNNRYLYLETFSMEVQLVVPHYLKGIHKVKIPLMLHTNDGKNKIGRKGYLGGTACWLDERGIANVISLKMLEEKLHVTYDSHKEGGAFVCKTPKGNLIFRRCFITKFPYLDLS